MTGIKKYYKEFWRKRSIKRDFFFGRQRQGVWAAGKKRRGKNDDDTDSDGCIWRRQRRNFY